MLLYIRVQNTFIPKFLGEITPTENKKALVSIISVNGNCWLHIKIRFCAECCKQRYDILKEESVSLTVKLDSIIITYSINYHDKQDLVVVHLPGAYFSTKIDDLANMVLRGKLVDLVPLMVPGLYQK